MDQCGRLERLAGIETGTLDDLRRTSLSNWVAQGLGLHEAQQGGAQAQDQRTQAKVLCRLAVVAVRRVMASVLAVVRRVAVMGAKKRAGVSNAAA